MQFHKQYTEPRTAVLINTKTRRYSRPNRWSGGRRAGAEMKVMARTRAPDCHGDVSLGTVFNYPVSKSIRPISFVNGLNCRVGRYIIRYYYCQLKGIALKL